MHEPVAHILAGVTRAGALSPLQSQRPLTRRPYGEKAEAKATAMAAATATEI
jgi:hypothetical protein